MAPGMRALWICLASQDGENVYCWDESLSHQWRGPTNVFATLDFTLNTLCLAHLRMRLIDGEEY